MSGDGISSQKAKTKPQKQDQKDVKAESPKRAACEYRVTPKSQYIVTSALEGLAKKNRFVLVLFGTCMPR